MRSDRAAASALDIHAGADVSPDGRAVKHIAKQLRRAHVERGGGSGDGNPLSESVVVLHGQHREHYLFWDQDAEVVGVAGLVAEGPPGFRARYEVLDVEGRPLCALLIASRLGDDPDLVLAPDGSELVRLEKAWAGREGIATPHGLPVTLPPRNRIMRRMKRLGLEPRVAMGHGAAMGLVHRPPRPRRGRQVVEDATGSLVAVIARTRGGAGPTGTGRDFVIEHHQSSDSCLRTVALLVGVLWDWYIDAWEPGG